MSSEIKASICSLKDIRNIQTARRLKLRGRESQPIIDMEKTMKSFYSFFEDSCYITDSDSEFYVDHGVSNNGKFKSIEEDHKKKIFLFFLQVVFSSLLFVYNTIDDLDYVYRFKYTANITSGKTSKIETRSINTVFAFRELSKEIDVFYVGESNPVKFSLARRFDEDGIIIDDLTSDCAYLKIRGIMYSIIAPYIHKIADSCAKENEYNSIYSFMKNISNNTFMNKNYCFNKSFYATESLENKLKIIGDLKYIFEFLGPTVVDEQDMEKRDISEFEKTNLQWFKF